MSIAVEVMETICETRSGEPVRLRGMALDEHPISASIAEPVSDGPLVRLSCVLPRPPLPARGEAPATVSLAVGRTDMLPLRILEHPGDVRRVGEFAGGDWTAASSTGAPRLRPFRLILGHWKKAHCLCSGTS